jgi:alpha-beta hydrolase superfamily lysophospholipase
VHGFAQNRFSWRLSRRSFVAHLAAEGFEVLNFELRGHGLSREYGAGNASEFHEYVLDAQRVVRRCARPPFVVGHSLGGAVGIGVATETELAGLVHLAGVYGFASRNRTLRALAHATLAWEPWLRSLPVNVSTGWAGDVISRLYAVTDIAGYGAPIAGWAPDSIERDLLDERLSLGFDWTSLAVWLQMSRWATGEPLAYREAFGTTDVPLLVIAGDNDPLVRPGDARDCFEGSGSTDKELLIFDPFEHQVHWGHIDLIVGRLAPDEVWPRITAWLTDRS